MLGRQSGSPNGAKKSPPKKGARALKRTLASWLPSRGVTTQKTLSMEPQRGFEIATKDVAVGAENLDEVSEKAASNITDYWVRLNGPSNQ